MPETVEVFSADVSDSTQAAKAAEGATVVYQALNPPYHQWDELFPGLQAGAMAAAQAAGARYVSIDNLYMYGLVDGAITESTPVNPCSRKGELRAKMADDLLAAHKAGDIQAAIVRSSDYYGPGVVQSALGERTFGPLIAGKGGEVIANPDLPHSYAYIEDVARAAVAVGASDDALGKVSFTAHAPARSQRAMIEDASSQLGMETKVNVVSPWMLWAFGLFSPPVREMNEMMYEYTNPFVVDASQSEQALGLMATPTSDGLAGTIEWFRGQQRA